MNYDQMFALSLCWVIGIGGLAMRDLAKETVWKRVGLCWAIFWWLPPLAAIWVKGIFG